MWPVPVPVGTDSSYVLPAGSLPSLQPHNVLIEEFSGQACSNCPGGHTTLDGIEASHPGRVNIVTMYFKGQPQAIPPSGAIYDFRNDTAYSITQLIYSDLAGLPSSGVDRIGSSRTFLGASSWAGPITSQLTPPVPDSINLGISSSYNTLTGIATITDTVTYLYNVYGHQNVSIYVVEDSLIDKQEFPTTINPAYLFMDVFQAMVNSAPMGNPVLDSMVSKPQGQVYWRKYTFNPSTTRIVNPRHCRVVAFINNQGTGGDYRVLQSVQCKLVP